MKPILPIVVVANAGCGDTDAIPRKTSRGPGIKCRRRPPVQQNRLPGCLRNVSDLLDVTHENTD